MTKPRVLLYRNSKKYLKVINISSYNILVFLSEYAFGACVRQEACEIYGIIAGSRQCTISIGTDDECNNYTNEVDSDFTAIDGETYTIEVTNDFFTKK